MFVKVVTDRGEKTYNLSNIIWMTRTNIVYLDEGYDGGYNEHKKCVVFDYDSAIEYSEDFMFVKVGSRYINTKYIICIEYFKDCNETRITLLYDMAYNITGNHVDRLVSEINKGIRR